MKMFKGTKGMVILVFLVLLVLGYYFYLSNRSVPEKTEEISVETMTVCQKV